MKPAKSPLKKLSGLILLAVFAVACGKGGLSASVDEGADYAMQTVATIPDFDFTDMPIDPDLDVEYPLAVTTTTSSTVTTSTLPVEETTTTTTVTAKISLPVIVTTTTLRGSPVTTSSTTTTTTLPVEVKPENEIEPEFDPSKILPGAIREDFDGMAELSPTIYFKAIINETGTTCADDAKISIVTPTGEEILKACRSTYDTCRLEGSCVISQGDKKYPINIVGRNAGGVRTFMIIDVNRCPYGYGTKSTCLDPYFTLAADPKFYKNGDVIYIPSIAGLNLGNGRRHHGFFVIRDTGDGILGRGRFDFFTGYHTDTSSKNIFRHLKLGDASTRLKYYRLKNPSALGAYIKKMRNYPNLPSSK